MSKTIVALPIVYFCYSFDAGYFAKLRGKGYSDRRTEVESVSVVKQKCEEQERHPQPCIALQAMRCAKRRLPSIEVFVFLMRVVQSGTEVVRE